MLCLSSSLTLLLSKIPLLHFPLLHWNLPDFLAHVHCQVWCNFLSHWEKEATSEKVSLGSHHKPTPFPASAPYALLPASFDRWTACTPTASQSCPSLHTSSTPPCPLCDISNSAPSLFQQFSPSLLDHFHSFANLLSHHVESDGPIFPSGYHFLCSILDLTITSTRKKTCFYPHPKTVFHCFEREREGGKPGEEKERNINVREKYQLVAFWTCPTEDWTCNPGICPDQELNPQPFGAQDDTPTNQDTSAMARICLMEQFGQKPNWSWFKRERKKGIRGSKSRHFFQAVCCRGK